MEASWSLLWQFPARTVAELGAPEQPQGHLSKRSSEHLLESVHRLGLENISKGEIETGMHPGLSQVRTPPEWHHQPGPFQAPERGLESLGKALQSTGPPEV